MHNTKTKQNAASNNSPTESVLCASRRELREQGGEFVAKSGEEGLRQEMCWATIKRQG